MIDLTQPDVTQMGGSTATPSYTYTDSNNLPDSGSTFIWYRATNASGTSSKTIATSSTWAIAQGDNNRYLKVCVTPKNGANFGNQACSTWTPVGHIIQLFTDESWLGTNANVAYEAYQSGICFGFPSALNDAISSYKFNATSNYAATVWFYKDGSCSGTSARRTIAAGSGESISSMNGTLGNGWNDVLSSFRVVYNDSVSAESVSLTISGNTATPSYTFTTTSDLTESGSTYTYSRANDGSGNGAASIGTSKVWTLTASDLDKYLQFCVTPSDGTTTGSPTCSSWTSVGRLVAMYNDQGYLGTSAFIAYQRSSSDTCFNLTGNVSFNDVITSLKFFGNSGGQSTLHVYKDVGCAGSTESFDAAAGTEYDVTNVGTSWNDSISAIRVTY